MYDSKYFLPNDDFNLRIVKNYFNYKCSSSLKMDKNFSNAFPIKKYNNKKDYFAAQNLVLCDFSASKDANQALIV